MSDKLQRIINELQGQPMIEAQVMGALAGILGYLDEQSDLLREIRDRLPVAPGRDGERVG